MVNKVNILIFVFFFIFANTIVSADVKTDIYSKLKCCPCKEPFITCVCPHAKEIKAYVEALLGVGLNEEDILLKLAKKYSLDVIIDKQIRQMTEKRLIELAGDERPEIFIKPKSYNFGKVSRSKGELGLLVELQNKGSKTLTIGNLKTSCECTTVKLKTKNSLSSSFGIRGAESDWKMDLAPGEKAELNIITDLNHHHVKLGHLLRTVEIRSNDPVHSLIKVEFEAEIVE